MGQHPTVLISKTDGMGIAQESCGREVAHKCGWERGQCDSPPLGVFLGGGDKEMSPGCDLPPPGVVV